MLVNILNVSLMMSYYDDVLKYMKALHTECSLHSLKKII